MIEGTEKLSTISLCLVVEIDPKEQPRCCVVAINGDIDGGDGLANSAARRGGRENVQFVYERIREEILSGGVVARAQ